MMLNDNWETLGKVYIENLSYIWYYLKKQMEFGSGNYSSLLCQLLNFSGIHFTIFCTQKNLLFQWASQPILWYPGLMKVCCRSSEKRFPLTIVLGAGLLVLKQAASFTPAIWHKMRIIKITKYLLKVTITIKDLAITSGTN